MAQPTQTSALSPLEARFLMAVGAGLLALAAVWPLLDYLSNDDINYIRDTAHLSLVYVWSGRHLAGLATEVLRLFGDGVVQAGPFLRILVLVMGPFYFLSLLHFAGIRLDRPSAALIASMVVTYPLALDLYSFNVNAIVVLLMYAVMVGYVRRMAPLFDRRPSVLTTLVLVVGLFFYQSVVMYAAMAALVVCFHKAESFRQLIVALVFRAIEVVAAVVISLIVREGLDYMLANFAGMQMRDMKPLALIDSETSAQKLGQFTEKFVDIVFGANRHFFAVTKWTIYAACLAAVGYTLVRTRDTLCSIPRWKRLVSPLFLVGLLLLASNPYSIVTTAGVLNNRQWGHGGLVFATLAAMSISLVGNVALSRFLAAGCALAMAINGSVVAFEAKRTSGTEALLTNRIVAEIEAVEGYNPRITPVGIIDRLNLYFFDGARRSHGGGLSPRITKSAYSALSEVAGYEFRKPNGNQSARMKKRCDALEAETRYGIFYRVEPFENGVVVCFFTPRNQPRK